MSNFWVAILSGSITTILAFILGFLKREDIRNKTRNFKLLFARIIIYWGVHIAKRNHPSFIQKKLIIDIEPSNCSLYFNPEEKIYNITIWLNLINPNFRQIYIKEVNVEINILSTSILTLTRNPLKNILYSHSQQIIITENIDPNLVERFKKVFRGRSYANADLHVKASFEIKNKPDSGDIRRRIPLELREK